MSNPCKKKNSPYIVNVWTTTLFDFHHQFFKKKQFVFKLYKVSLSYVGLKRQIWINIAFFLAYLAHSSVWKVAFLRYFINNSRRRKK